LAIFIGALLASITVASPARAQSVDQGSVQEFYGAFGTDVSISVPQWRGISPNITLHYSSTSPNGWAGVGWGVGGSSLIQRASAALGVPTYNDATDVFLLDGVQLVPCAVGSQSPSCLTGGTHSAKVENYSRITRNTTNNTWTVTGKNGLTATYKALTTVTNGTYNWALSTFADRLGNTATYSYWCDSGTASQCYLSTISYNGTVITFYNEARPDPTTFALGAASLGTMAYRLKTIGVQVNGSTLRAYTLAYTTSNTSGRSMLSSVTQYGRDATISGSAVTGGTALPAHSLGYTANSHALTASTPGVAEYGNWGSDSSASRIYNGDVNGDGKVDTILGPDSSGCWYVLTSTGATLTNRGAWICGAYANWQGGGPRIHAIDVNGDGMSDIEIGPDSSGNWYVMLSTGTSFVDKGAWVTGAYGQFGDNSDAGRIRPMDVNGDGKMDIVIGPDSPGNWYVLLSTGTSFLNEGAWVTAYGNWDGSADRTYTVDVNGDGRSDIILGPDASGCWYVLTSTGTSFTNNGAWICGAYSQFQSGPARIRTIDVNGDGKTDVSIGPDANGDWAVLLSAGNSFVNAGYWAVGAYGNWGSDSDSPRINNVDYNGDGRMDYVIGPDANGCWYGLRSTGQSWANDGALLCGTDSQWQGSTARIRAVDLQGVGKSQILMGPDSSGYWYMVSPPTTAPDLMSSTTNGAGGTTTVSYTPSSAWQNTYLPLGMIAETVSATTTTDGRGASSTVNYSYQGALWSATERQFLGFRYVKSVVDAAGDYTETYYHQSIGSISKPDSTYLRDPTGNIYTYSLNTYTENASAPYTSLLTTRWDYECDRTTSCRRVLTQFAFDQYGNASTTYEYGDYDVSGDERTTVRGYFPNTANYIVGFEGYENMYSGIGTTGTLLKQALYVYDSNTTYTQPATTGLLTQTMNWNSDTGGYLTKKTTFDALGSVIAEYDAMGNQTSAYTYDSSDTYLVKSCDALGHCASKTYDTVLGIETSAVNANGGTTVTTLDVFGRPVSQTTADGTVTTYAYLSFGSPTSEHVHKVVEDGTPAGQWSDTYTDGLGRVWRVVATGGITSDTIYSDTSSRIWKKSAPYAAGETPVYTVYAYDGAGRPSTVTYPDGTEASTAYGVGYVTTTDELGRQSTVWSDAYGKVVDVRDYLGSTTYDTTYTRNALGVATAVTDAAGHAHTYAFNSLGWLKSECDPDVGCSSYTYDADGHLLTATDAKGQTKTNQYDILGRRVSRTRSDGDATTWHYDESGHGAGIGEVTSVTDASGSSSFTYDAMGRVPSATKCIHGTCETLLRAFDAAGRLSSVTYPDAETVAYGYDADGRPVSVSGYVNGATYNSRGQILSVTYANGTTANFTYDNNRAWLTNSTVTSGATTLYEAGYSYDAAAEVTSVSSSTNSLFNVSYAYDSMGRLVSVSGASSQAFTYDALGNITSNSAVGSYAYGAAAHVHAVTSAGSNVYTYDANGNMVSGAGRTLTWNPDNVVTSIVSGGETVAFDYDYSGQRVYKNGPNGTDLYFGTFDIVNGSLVKYYFFANARVAKRDATGTYWYHQDHLGSVRLITNSVGSEVSDYDYASFGATLASTSQISNDFGWGGHREDAETGLVYMGARYYDSSLGRFISADSVIPDEFKSQALNRYSFGYNNPISNVDPTGHMPVVSAIASVAISFVTGAPVWVLATVSAGAATSVAGYATHNEWLTSIGSILEGIGGGGFGYLKVSNAFGNALIGGAASAVTSPVSPLPDDLKTAIGWAYTAQGLGKVMHDQIVAHLAREANHMASASGPTCANKPSCSVVDVGETPSRAIRWVDSNNVVHYEITGVGTGAWMKDLVKDDLQRHGEDDVTKAVEADIQADRTNGYRVVVVSGHSLGAWEAVIIAHDVHVDHVLAIALPVEAVSQFSDSPMPSVIEVVDGTHDPIPDLHGQTLEKFRYNIDVMKSQGWNVREVDTGTNSLTHWFASHALARYCAAGVGCGIE
jgi:RHS repeat-associated protein